MYTSAGIGTRVVSVPDMQSMNAGMAPALLMCTGMVLRCTGNACMAPPIKIKEGRPYRIHANIAPGRRGIMQRRHNPLHQANSLNSDASRAAGRSG